MLADGVDLAAFEDWLDENRIGEGPLTDVAPIRGGSQNLLLGFTRSGRRLVLRRTPSGKGTERSSVLRREARILTALAATEVPFPRLVGACTDETVLGGAFHVAEHVDGFTFWGAVPDPWATDARVVHGVGLQIVEAFAALACVDHVAVGLADLGRDGWLERQPERWRRQLVSYAELDGETGERIPGAAGVHKWLVDNLPGPSRPGLIHGDAHLGNVMVRTDRTGVALVDWELCTIGDPRLDLAQLLVTWPSHGGAYHERVTVAGLPDAAEVVERWTAVSDRESAEMRWFCVLAAYRLAVLLEGTYARARAGSASMATGEQLHTRACALLDTVREGSDCVGL